MEDSDRFIVQIDGALDREPCQRLMELYDSGLPQCTVRDATGHGVFYCFSTRMPARTVEFLVQVVRKCSGRVDALFAEQGGPFYPETVALTAIGPGGFHARHADNCERNAAGDWQPNHTPQRAISAIYYLNDDFLGGEICFPNQRLTIQPRKGLLLLFPSTRHYVHEVLKVIEGSRYTMPIWFTREKNHDLRIPAW
jgi:hypothetical protein